jgi:rhodanese-related sulfurtransferase
VAVAIVIVPQIIKYKEKTKGGYDMNKGIQSCVVLLIVLLVSPYVYAGHADFAARVQALLEKGPENDNYHVTAKQVSQWIKEKKRDFFILDVRIPPEHGDWGRPEYGHIPGSVYVPYTEVFKMDNLRKLPKKNKIVVVGHMGVYENYLVVPLRLLGYDAYFMLMGMSGWQKDYPAVGHVNMLINAPKKMNFPLEK